MGEVTRSSLIAKTSSSAMLEEWRKRGEEIATEAQSLASAYYRKLKFRCSGIRSGENVDAGFLQVAPNSDKLVAA